MAVVVNDQAAREITVGGKPRALRAVTIVDLPPVVTGRADAQWLWLTGSPVPRHWREAAVSGAKGGSGTAGAFELRWTEPLSKAEFDAARLLGADGKALPKLSEGTVASVWLDTIDAGWEALSRAAIGIVAAIPAGQRDEAFRALETATHTPGDHWRAALLRRAIHPETPAPPDFQPEALNTLALQIGDQWAGAIGRLARVEPQLAQQVARRLLTIAYLPTGESTGTWEVLWAEADPDTLDTLLSAPEGSLATAMTGFLAAQPGHVAWVHDDAGLRDPISGGTLTSAAFVSFADRPQVAMVRQAGTSESEPRSAEPLIGQLFTAAVGRGGAEPGGAGGLGLTFKLGQTPISLAPVATPIRATPPGVLIGPFSLDWTLASFQRQQPVRVGGIAGALMPSPGAAGAWSLYLERRAEREADLGSERLRVWAGPTGNATVCVEVTPDGGVAPINGAASCQVSRIPGGWCAIVTLPANAVDDRGLLRLAVEHTASTGMRSCWPRPMLPWQTEPGRLAIDAAAWDRELRP